MNNSTASWIIIVTFIYIISLCFFILIILGDAELIVELTGCLGVDEAEMFYQCSKHLD